MSHVMISYILPILIGSLSQLTWTSAQESFLWSDPQLSSDEWHPFIPSSYIPHGERQLQTYPRTDTIRQYFGKTPVEPVQNQPPVQQNPALKKSFQASPSTANNIDQYAIAPVLSSFNSFGVQTVQTRNPIFDKNIKDGHLLEQPTQYQFKYQPHPQQQQQQVATTVHRFPSFFHASGYDPFQRQPSVNVQQASFHGHAAPSFPANRYENAVKQTPSRVPVTTTIQVFPPPPIQSGPVQHGQFGQNTYYLNVPPPPKEDYDNEPKQPHQHYREGNIQKNVFGSSRPEQQQFYDNVKTPPSDRFEFVLGGGNTPYRGSNAIFSSAFGTDHIRGVAKKPDNDLNPSKQVFDQLSPLGRPFTLPKDGGDIDSESLSSYSSAPRPSTKKTKTKSNQPVSSLYHRTPASNSANSIIDYESGKLQAVKSVTYLPQRDVIRFNENDLIGNNVFVYEPTSEKQLPHNGFLPTPTDSSENEHNTNIVNGLTYTYNNRFTTSSTTAAPVHDHLPHNHKYSPTNIRHRTPASHRQQQTTDEEASRPESYENGATFGSLKTSFDNSEYETTTTMVTTITRRNPLVRRRKPAKNKTRTRTTPTLEPSSTTEEYNYPKVASANDYQNNNNNNNVRLSYYDLEDQNVNKENDMVISSEDSTAASTTTATPYVKKKHNKVRTTTSSPEEEYPNYPLEYLNRQQQSSTMETYSTDITSTNSYYTHQNSAEQAQTQEEDRESVKPNYPVISRPKIKPNFAVRTTTEAPVSSTPKTRTKSKLVSSTTGAPNAVNITRPRFSIKDYKRTTTVSSLSSKNPTTSAPSAAASDDSLSENAVEIEKKENRQKLFTLRTKNRNKLTAESDSPAGNNANREENSTVKKYKPRIRPSRYKISSSTSTTVSPAPVEPTSERVNTFRPASGGRIKSSTSKYYNRFRTTTESLRSDDTNEDTVQASSSNIKPTRTLLFSAKKTSVADVSSSKSPSTLPPRSSNKVVEYDDEDEDIVEEDYEEDSDEDHVIPIYPKSVTTILPDKSLSKVEKADNIFQSSLMTNAEVKAEKKEKSKTNSTKDETSSNLAVITMEGKDSEDDFSFTSTSSPSTASTSNTESPTTTTLLSEEAEQENEDDINERVSKITMLTSQDESHRVNGVAAAGSGSTYKHHWKFPLFSIKKISASDY